MPEDTQYGITAIFCDDIRREDNGKLLLIGVYPEGITIAGFPASFPMSFWLRLTGLPLGDGVLRFRMLINGVSHVEGEAPFQVVDTTKPLNLFFPQLSVNIDRVGSVVIDMTLPDGQAVGVAELNVSGPPPQLL